MNQAGYNPLSVLHGGQVRDAYQSLNDAKQNNNMTFLTAISTIFFPLALITGWYGMNFQNMSELENAVKIVNMPGQWQVSY